MSALSMHHGTYITPEAAPVAPRRMPRMVLLGALVIVVGSMTSLALERFTIRDPFPLRAIRFDGDLGHVREQDLQGVVSAELDGGLLLVDVARLRQAVEALPWVASASVRRVWPDALRITVTEQVPVAQWNEAGLLNGEAEVFRPESRPDGLPALAGPTGSEREVLTAWRWLTTRLAGIGERVTAVRLDARRAWTVELAGGTTLVLGRAHTESRIERLIDTWTRLDMAGRTPRVIDLRYPNGYAVRWQAQEPETDRSEGTASQ